jgi:hypothetical protein
MSRLVVAKQKARAQTDKVIELVDDGYKMRFGVCCRTSVIGIRRMYTVEYHHYKSGSQRQLPYLLT